MSLTALSPLDGRYAPIGVRLGLYFSEAALIKYRVIVMVEWLRHVTALKIGARPLTDVEEKQLLKLTKHFGPESAEIVKAIETKGLGKHKRTNHDVKACELFIRDFLAEHGMEDLVEWVHFGRTSEDVNNIAYALMVVNALRDEMIPTLSNLDSALTEFSKKYADVPMLARTHGQPATPTTLGKEIAVFAYRIRQLFVKVNMHKLCVKSNGATGNHAAEHAALPNIDWHIESQRFCRYLGLTYASCRLNYNSLTTQIESHDSFVELCNLLQQVNSVLYGFAQDMWHYISDDWIVQKPVDGEVGSSAMPHKVNPINFENAWAHCGLANALFGHFAQKLPISRLQRDLSDSATQRYIGEAFGMTLKAYEEMLSGLKKVAPNEEKIRAVLREHPEVLTEAYQTILRSVGFPDPYGALRHVSRGQKLTIGDLHAFVTSLDHPSVTPDVRTRMLALTAETYIGIAPQLARLI